MASVEELLPEIIDGAELYAYMTNFIKHSHCPNECEHPQPMTLETGVEICGSCWYHYHIITNMIPCTPETCLEMQNHQNTHADESSSLQEDIVVR